MWLRSAKLARGLRLLSFGWAFLVLAITSIEYMDKDHGIFVYRKFALAYQGYRFAMPDGKTYDVSPIEREAWVQRERDLMLNGRGTFFNPKSSSMVALTSIPAFMGFRFDRILGFILAGFVLLNLAAVCLEPPAKADNH